MQRLLSAGQHNQLCSIYWGIQRFIFGVWMRATSLVQWQTTASQTLAHGSCSKKCFSILYHATKLFFIAYVAYNDMTMQLSRWPKTNCNSCFNSRVFLGNKTTCYILKQRTCHMKIPVGYLYGMESSSVIDMSDE